MFISALLTLLVAALLYGSFPDYVLLALCIVVFAVVFLMRRKKHRSRTGLTHIDAIAQKSRITQWNAGLKILTCICLLALCIGADSMAVSLLILGSITIVNLATSRIGFVGYLSLLTIPLIFITLSGLVLLIEISPQPLGLIDIPLMGMYMCVTEGTQAYTASILLKAIAAVSCLYCLSLSTPIYEITSFLRRVHLPSIVVELMILIYRYVFVLLDSLYSMNTAAQARLGYRTYRNSWRSFAGIASNLLVRSFARASRSFDAMEARAYQGEIRFLEQVKPVTAAQIGVAVVMVIMPSLLLLAERAIL